MSVTSGRSTDIRQCDLLPVSFLIDQTASCFVRPFNVAHVAMTLDLDAWCRPTSCSVKPSTISPSIKRFSEKRRLALYRLWYRILLQTFSGRPVKRSADKNLDMNCFYTGKRSPLRHADHVILMAPVLSEHAVPIQTAILPSSP